MTKADLHQLVDALPESEQETAFRILKCLTDEKKDPFLQALAAAEEDDEPFTLEDQEAIRLSLEAADRGEIISWEESTARLRDLP